MLRAATISTSNTAGGGFPTGADWTSTLQICRCPSLQQAAGQYASVPGADDFQIGEKSKEAQMPRCYSKRRRTRQTSGRRFRPSFERLEDRRLLTIAYAPQFGFEGINNSPSNPKLVSPPVYLIFVGDYWNDDGAGASQRLQIIAGVQNTISGPYLQGLLQYGPLGVATYGGDTVDALPLVTNFTTGDLQNTVTAVIDDPNSQIPRPTTPAHLPIYLVFTPPGISASDETEAAGYHTSSYPLYDSTLVFGWVGTNGHVDYALNIFSHELVESISDPMIVADGNPVSGVTTTHGDAWTGGGAFEICDAEAQNYLLPLEWLTGPILLVRAG